ncbi:MAG: penicillin-binding protein 2 [Parcubacteria group bacterium]
MLPDKYRIKNIDEDQIAPEETLADALSDHSAVELPIGFGVFRIFYVIIIFVLIFFVGKAFQLQILEGESYAYLVDKGRLTQYPIPSLRGIIYDVNGIALVENTPTFDLVILSSKLVGNEQSRNLANVSRILNINITELGEIMAKYEDQAIFALRKNISKDDALAIETLQMSGFYIVPYAKRFYPYAESASHILGYTTNINETELEESTYYAPTDRVGRLGIESSYEKSLRGERRTYDLINKSFNQGLDTVSGYNIHTSIDIEVQEKLYDSMDRIFRANGIKRGAGIVQNAYTGEVIGIVSLPSFDSNIFESSAGSVNQERIEYVLDSSLQPLFNRVVGGLYAPGSTIKPLFALAGLKEGVVTEDTLIHSPGYIEVQSEIDSSVVYTFKDWKAHGWTDIRKAIADSVDVYFYTLGGGYGDIEGLGIAKINKYITLFFADRKLGIDLPLEGSGTVPSRKWKEDVKGEAWYVGDTYNVSIGQGDLAVTPLWINSYIGSIANGGNLMRPYVVTSITDENGDLIKTFQSEKLEVLPFKKETLDIVRSGMRQTITEGTARSLNNLPVAVAGKTGTAQVTNNQLNSLFTAFGPYEDPEIVLTVIVENIGEDQSLATQVARDFLMWYFDPTRLSTI